MKIFGIGTDIINIKRIEKSLKRDGSKFKGIRKGINLRNIEISNDVNGKPSINLKGAVDNHLKKQIKRKKYNIHLSLSDDMPWAQATVIITYN